VFEAFGFPLDADGDKNYHKLGVRVCNRSQCRPHGRQRNREFLTQLPLDRGSIGFPCFAFSAGKLPQAAMPFMERPAANEHTILPGDYCGHNADFGEVHDRKMFQMNPIKPRQK
jgi:hypothetical protein